MGDANASTRLEVLAQVKRGLGLPLAPLTFGRYTLRRELGTGGLGIVYAAFDPQLDREVAIKFLRADRRHDISPSASSLPPLLREAQAMARVAHPNVIAVYDVGTYGPDERPEQVGAAGRGVFLVMELVDGLDLQQWLRADRHGWRRVVEVFLAAARGLAAAHDQGLVHRDFKPTNVLVGRDGRPRVLDFGLARAHDDARDELIVGTPAYMSPEQTAGEELDARSDIFAFCVALREALVTSGPASERERPEAALPRALRDVVARGLARDRDQRPATMHVVIRALERALARPRRIAIAAASIAALGLAAFAGHAALAEHRALEQCRAAEHTAAALWSDAVAGQVRARFVASGSPAAEDAFGRVDGILVDRLREWSELRVEACTSVVRDPAGVAVLGPRIECLDRTLRRIEGVVELLGQADGDVVVRARSAVDAIRPAGDCPASPPDRDRPPAELDAELERAMAKAEALAAVGNVAASVEAWQRLLAERTELDDGARAQVLLGLGAAQAGVGDYDAADRTLREGMRAAERAGAELVGLRMLEVRARVALMHDRIDDAREYAQWAEARAARGAFPPKYAASIALLLAGVAYGAGELDEAGRIAERVRVEAAELADADLESKAERILGVTAAAEGRFDDGLAHLRRAVEIEIDAHGRYSPTVASELVNVADLELRLGQLDATESTLAHIRESVAAGGQTGHPIGVLAGLLEAQLRAAQGRTGEAMRLAELGAEAAARTFGPTHRHTGMAHVLLAEALVAEHRDEPALVAARRAIAIFEGSPHHAGLADALRVAGEAATGLGRLAEARELQERARAIEAAAVDEPGI